MRASAPFKPDDLADLDQLLAQATAVVPMTDVYLGARDARIIGLRHDVDNLIEPAVAFAEWERARGYRSTYYILHSAPYWQDKPLLRESLEIIADCGHEIGIHNAALSEAINAGRDPALLLMDAIEELRSYGYRIDGTVAHGAAECYGADGQVRVVNDELFTECARPQQGPPDRLVAGTLQLRPRSLAKFGLDYDANWLGRGQYLSDSGGQWSQPFDRVAREFPFAGQLHMLVHPDWWQQAFVPVAA